MAESKQFDVAIVGGGPSGTTCACYLKQFRPDIRVAIFERETFPRDHVGESQLPMVTKILSEIGVWEKVEAANFPVKIGATYRWGISDNLWDFNFLAAETFRDEPRPAKYEGQRTQTAFQVDRGIYDKILLDHTREQGVEVYENTTIREILRTGDHIDALITGEGTRIEADYYVDGSGNSGVIRRAMGIAVVEPSNLKNIAIWDYWQNAEWAVTLGNGGTRIQVASLGYGWLWFIPIGPTRTSLGLVVPAEYYKRTGLKPEELYMKAVQEEPRIMGFLKNATREHLLHTTRDWSYVAELAAGDNWFLLGEAAGFADPILSAGMSLAHVSGKEAAFSILDMGKGRDEWLRHEYSERQKRKVRQHIRFADYWYTANDHFDELKEFTREIAQEAGLVMGPEDAFRWLSTGGFVEEDMASAGVGFFTLDSMHVLERRLSGKTVPGVTDGFSGFLLNLKGAEQVQIPHYENGHVHGITGLRRDGKTLPLNGFFGWVVAGLQHSPTISIAGKFIRDKMTESGIEYDALIHSRIIQALEAMARDGWVKCKVFKDAAPLSVKFEESGLCETNRDAELMARRNLT